MITCCLLLIFYNKEIRQIDKSIPQTSKNNKCSCTQKAQFDLTLMVDMYTKGQTL